MAQGMGGGQDSSGPDGLGAGSFGGDQNGDQNGNQNGGGDPSADYGGQGEFDGLGSGNTSANTSGNTSADASFPGEFGPPGRNYGVDTDVDYGAYDGSQLSTQQLGHPGATFSHNWDNPNTQFSPMESTPVQGYAQPEHALDAIAARNLAAAQETESTAPPTSVTGTPSKRAYRGTPAITTGPTVSPTVDPAQEAKTKQMRAVSVVQGWKDLFSKSRKNWGPFKNFAPVYDKQIKTAIVQDLYDKYNQTLQEATNEHSKKVNQEIEENGLGWKGVLPGYALVQGLFGLMGLEQEHLHPGHKALRDMMEDVGLIEKDHGESDAQTESQKKANCESKGYKWDSALQACIKTKSGSTSESSEEVSGASATQAGIVWKPVSESDGNLVILTPSSFLAASVVLQDAQGNVIDIARNMGRTNGGRYTYRFSKPGAGYKGPLVLSVGGVRYSIDDPSARIN